MPLTDASFAPQTDQRAALRKAALDGWVVFLHDRAPTEPVPDESRLPEARQALLGYDALVFNGYTGWLEYGFAPQAELTADPALGALLGEIDRATLSPEARAALDHLLQFKAGLDRLVRLHLNWLHGTD